MVMITVKSSKYIDYDDCLAAAADDVRRLFGLDGYDLDARWADDSTRDEIVLTVPDCDPNYMPCNTQHTDCAMVE